MPDSRKTYRLHILPLQERDQIMAARLIIDGNTVYEIDEDCMKCRKNKNHEDIPVKKTRDDEGKKT